MLGSVVVGGKRHVEASSCGEGGSRRRLLERSVRRKQTKHPGARLTMDKAADVRVRLLTASVDALLE